MLSEVQKNKFTTRAQEEAKKLLLESKIEKFLLLDDSGRFIEILDFEVASLVNAQEDSETIDEKLFEIYDLLNEHCFGQRRRFGFLKLTFL